MSGYFDILDRNGDVNKFIGAKQSHVKISWLVYGGGLEPIEFYLDDEPNLQRFLYAHKVGRVSCAYRLPDQRIAIEA